MMNAHDVPQPSPHAPVSHLYVIVSLSALAVILLVLLHWGTGRWSFLPVLVGLLEVILRRRVTQPSGSTLDRRIAGILSPLLMVILLAGLLIASEVMDLPTSLRSPARGFSLPDWFLSGAVLGFCLAQYRIQAMAVSIFPQDDHRRHQDRHLAAPKPSPHHRSPRLVTQAEIGWLVVSLPIWAFIAQLLWRGLPDHLEAYGLTPQARRGIILVWLLGLGVLIVAWLRSYTDLRRLRKREARLFMLDALWQETGHEQRRLARWLTWASLRRRRKEKR